MKRAYEHVPAPTHPRTHLPAHTPTHPRTHLHTYTHALAHPRAHIHTGTGTGTHTQSETETHLESELDCLVEDVGHHDKVLLLEPARCERRCACRTDTQPHTRTHIQRQTFGLQLEIISMDSTRERQYLERELHRLVQDVGHHDKVLLLEPARRERRCACI